jgi:glycosyltransferase involved in cell wall biosynthesis
MAAISLIMPTYSEARLERANALYDMLKNESGCEIEVIVVCENPKIQKKLKYDKLICPPKRIGFNRAINIGEKFASHELCWWIDDYVIPEKGWGPVAIDAYWKRFPDGMGIMELSGFKDDCPKSLSTRRFMYSVNGGNWLWNEYIHCGDTETWEKIDKEKQFHVYPNPLWHRDKIDDDFHRHNMKAYGFDRPLLHEREKNEFKDRWSKDLQAKMKLWAEKTEDPACMEIYKNIWNL